MRSVLLAALLAANLISPAAFAGADEDFLAARDAFKAGDAKRLAAYAPRLQGTVLQPYGAYWSLMLRLDTASDAEVRGFLNANADSPLSERLRSEWLKRQGRRGNWAQFGAEYPLLLSPDTEVSCYRLQERLARGDTAALNDGRRYWFNGNSLPGSCGSVFDRMAASGKLSQEDVWARIRLALEQGNVSVARNVAVYLQDGQGSEFAAGLGSASDTPERFLSRPLSLRNRAERELALFAAYRLARTQPSLAAERWERLGAQFPADERQYAWGQIAYQAARRLDPGAPGWYAKAGAYRLGDAQLEWKARAALRVKRWDEVLSAIDAMSDTGRQQAVWRYWKARVFKAQGKVAAANAILAPLSGEFGYHGQLAMEELGSVAGPPAVAFKPSGDEVAAVRRLPGIQRALALHRLDMGPEANKEWVWATRGFSDRQLLAASELARREDWIDRSINTATQTVQLHDFTLRFPMPHYDRMSLYTRQMGLDDTWVYGLIRQESRFISTARSQVGASGMMQLMPSTARWVAKKMGVRNYTSSSINDLDTNLSFGTYYLRHVLDQLGGNPVLATAAYNAGPGRAQRWRDAKAMDGTIYTESIPLNETRDYVQKVMSNAAYYAGVFGRGVTAMKVRMGTVAGGNTPLPDNGEP